MIECGEYDRPEFVGTDQLERGPRFEDPFQKCVIGTPNSAETLPERHRSTSGFGILARVVEGFDFFLPVYNAAPPVTPLVRSGTRWNVQERSGTPWNAQERAGTPRNDLERPGTPRNALERPGTVWYAQERPGTPGTPRSALERFGTPSNAMERSGTPWYVLERPGTPWNALEHSGLEPQGTKVEPSKLGKPIFSNP